MINTVIPHWPEYELLDSGNGRKLERFGKYILNRIETQAIWDQSKNETIWNTADATFKRTEDQRGEWIYKTKIPKNWVLKFNDLKFNLHFTPFGHVGIFPDQSEQWSYLEQKIKTANKPIKALSLFTYTGASTLALAAAGANVTHVDASKQAITWARDNQNLSGLKEKPIRWIPDDAMKFVKREARRGEHYDVIVMDPPKFGHGPQGEIWKLEESLPELLDNCQQILSDNPLLILITAYTVPISSITLANLLSDAVKKVTGKVEYGELGLKQNTPEKILPTAIYAKWESINPSF